MLLKTQWVLTVLVLVWDQGTCHQGDAQGNKLLGRSIKEAISDLGNRIDEKLEVLLEDKLSQLLAMKLMPMHERFDAMENNLKEIKQDIDEEFKELKIKTDQCQEGRNWKQNCTDCLCRNGDIFCPTKGFDQPTTRPIGQSTTPRPINGKYMYEAGKRGDLEFLNNALALGTDINLKESDWPNRAALHGAAFGNHPEVASALLAAGADKDLQSDSGRTPVCEAAARGNVEVLNILIAHGADVNIPTDDGITPLMGAASQNMKRTVKILIAANATLDNVSDDTRGYTALHWAAWNNNNYIVQMLLSAGADTQKRTAKFNQAPADVARQYGYTIVAGMIDDSTG